MPPAVAAQQIQQARLDEAQIEMDIEEDLAAAEREAAEASLLTGEEEVEAMVEESDEEDFEETAQLPPAKVQRIWPEVTPERASRYKKEVETIRDMFEDQVDMYDTTMVSEYAEEIFEYMNELEVRLHLGTFVQVCR